MSSTPNDYPTPDDLAKHRAAEAMFAMFPGCVTNIGYQPDPHNPLNCCLGQRPHQKLATDLARSQLATRHPRMPSKAWPFSAHLLEAVMDTQATAYSLPADIGMQTSDVYRMLGVPTCDCPVCSAKRGVTLDQMEAMLLRATLLCVEAEAVAMTIAEITKSPRVCVVMARVRYCDRGGVDYRPNPATGIPCGAQRPVVVLNDLSTPLGPVILDPGSRMYTGTPVLPLSNSLLVLDRQGQMYAHPMYTLMAVETALWQTSSMYTGVRESAHVAHLVARTISPAYRDACAATAMAHLREMGVKFEDTDQNDGRFTPPTDWTTESDKE